MPYSVWPAAVRLAVPACADESRRSSPPATFLLLISRLCAGISLQTLDVVDPPWWASVDAAVRHSGHPGGSCVKPSAAYGSHAATRFVGEPNA
ncbi:hypothetical protein E2562_020871 [Oryza meyeriana var. granulata]|uniref:Uncharacterized protein n=1 Tax=Oryza meyeriana var. granulata TaxID=110450 RepID=A0A6G1D5Z0_9ORYZ|nr:hypothetical protein E2562_020871 [Oryza meyeriana var. granulata]